MRFYHNPRCSKSRQALALLEEREVEVEVIRYLEAGIREEDLTILAHLDNVVRKKEAGPDAMASLHGPAEIMALLRENPRALERPILVINKQAVIGRPPENILTLLKSD
ncbi:MAG: hypothetical protein L7R83_06300 [Candidatus Poseidonia sp.]|nr:hypothetical protein [Poseidonia sp.]